MASGKQLNALLEIDNEAKYKINYKAVVCLLIDIEFNFYTSNETSHVQYFFIYVNK